MGAPGGLTGALPPAAVSIDSIQEVSEGRHSEVFQRYPEGSFDPNCCFSIYHGSHRESLDLVSPSGEEARIWVTGLRYLMAGISDEDSLARRQRTRDQYPSAPGGGQARGPGSCALVVVGVPCPLLVAALGRGRARGPVLAPNSAPKWLKQTFAEADKNGDGSLSIGEVLQLLHKLNVNLPRQRVKQMFRVSTAAGLSLPEGAAPSPGPARLVDGVWAGAETEPLLRAEPAQRRAGRGARCPHACPWRWEL